MVAPMHNFIRIAITLSMVGGLTGAALAGDDKAAKPAPPPADKAPPAAMQPPKAPVEVGAAVKAAAGTWKCQGSAFAPDGTAMPMKATMKTKVALDGFWAQTSFAETKRG